MKKILLAGVVLCVVLAGCLLVAPGFVDWNKYRPGIVAQIQNATGYDVALDGDLEMALLPSPRLKVQGLGVAVADGDPLLTLDQASINMALWPLLSGKFIVRSVTLVKPVIALSAGADGKPLWMTPQLEALKQGKKEPSAEGKPDLAQSVALNAINIKDGAFSYTDKKSGKKTELTAINITLRGESLYGPYTVEGSIGYAGRTVGIDMKTGRFGAGAESVALQAKMALPNTGAAADFSGVVALKEPFEIQGEVSVKADSLSTLASLAGGNGLAGYEKPFSLQGMLTGSAEGLSLGNARISYAGNEISGSAGVKDLAAEQPEISFDFSAQKPMVIDSLLPPAKEGAKANTFIPETLVLPKDMTLKGEISLAEAQYKGQSFANAAIALEKKGGSFSYAVKSDAPGGGKLSESGSLDFAGVSRSPESGTLTLSDPALKFRVFADVKEPQKLLAPFVPAETLAGKDRILAGRAILNVEGVVKPRSASVEAGNLKIHETDLAFSGKFTRAGKGGRDALKLALSAPDVDADKWMVRLGEGKSTPSAVQEMAQAKKSPPDIAGMAAKMVLPVDLDLTLSFDKLRLNGQEYGKVSFRGQMKDKKLAVESAGLQDSAGNALTAAGTVADLTSLSGIDLSFGGKTKDVNALLGSFSVDTSKFPKNIGAGELSSEFKGQADALAFMANVKAMGGAMETSGMLAGLLKTPRVDDLTVRLRHADYAELARYFNPSFSSGVAIRKNLDVFATLKRTDKVYDISGIQAAIGPASMSGSVKLDSSKAKPDVTAVLQLGDVPLDSLTGASSSSGGAVKAQKRGGGAGASAQDIRWSRDAIDTQWMHNFNLDLKATAKSLSWGNWKIDNGVVNLVLKDGTLDVSKMEGAMYGGRAALTGKAASPGQPRQPLTISGTAVLQDVALESFVGSFSGARLLKAKGGISLNAEFETTGLSPAALVFDLHGKGDAKGKNFLFDGFDLARLSRAMFQSSGGIKESFVNVLDAAMSGGSTGFDTLDSAFTITEGVIKFDKLDLTGKDATVKTLGSVNLPLWTVDLASEIKLAQPADAPVLKAVFKGPLDRPGQTFGQGALENYFMQKVGQNLEKLLIKKLDKSGVLQQIIGPQQPGVPVQEAAPQAQQAPAPEAAQEPAAGRDTAPQPQPEPEPSQSPVEQLLQQMQKQQEPVKPEDAFKSILQNVIQQQ